MSLRKKSFHSFFFMLIFAALPGSSQTVFHLSPSGNDAWSCLLQNPGTNDGPCRTPQGARDAVRRWRGNGGTGAVTVRVQESVYRLSTTLDLAAQDGNAAWEAAPGARPVFSGGVLLPAFTIGTGGTWTTSLPVGMRVEEIWVAGKRATLARWPNSRVNLRRDVRLENAALIADAAASHFTLTGVEEINLGGGRFRRTAFVPVQAFALLQNLSAQDLARVRLWVIHNWDINGRIPVSLDVPRSGIVSEGEAMKTWNPWRAGNYAFLSNISSALDSAGEFFVTTANVVQYRPRSGETILSEAVAPALDRILRIHGDAPTSARVQNLVFRGLRFEHARWLLPAAGFEPQQAAASVGAAVEVEVASGVRFEDCTVAHFGGYGMWLRQGTQQSTVERCHVYDAGAGSLRVGETTVPGSAILGVTGNFVRNNILQWSGFHLPCAVGLFVGQAAGNTFENNDIGFHYYSGVSAGWTWGYAATPVRDNLFLKNHVHHMGGAVMSDMGAFYTLGLSPGTRVAGNIIHDIWTKDYGGWGLYTDEGSSNVLMENNLVYNTKTGSFHQHYGENNLIRNNILAYSGQWQLQLTRQEAHRSFDLECNLVYFTSGPIFNGVWSTSDVRLRQNMYWRTGSALTLDAWQVMPRDSGSRIADPLFMNPSAYDFRLQAGSPAPTTTCFTPFIIDAGVFGTPVWVNLAATGGTTDPVGILKAGKTRSPRVISGLNFRGQAHRLDGRKFRVNRFPPY